MRFRATPLLLAMVLPAGCTSHTSTVMDWSAFPPGRYGLYERASGRLILSHDLKPGDTFGVEYLESAGRSQSTALLTGRIKDAIGVTAKVSVVDANSIERSLGKAKRIVDRRPKG